MKWNQNWKIRCSINQCQVSGLNGKIVLQTWGNNLELGGILRALRNDL